jgi:hypothetical protein
MVQIIGNQKSTRPKSFILADSEFTGNGQTHWNPSSPKLMNPERDIHSTE